MLRSAQMIFLSSALAITFGLFAATSPARAARIWGWRNLVELPPGKQALYLLCYRVFGIVLCLGGVLFAIDNLVFSNYHR